MPEKDITSDTLILEVRKLKKQVAKIEKRVSKLQDPDDVLTPDDIAALDEADEDYRMGRTVPLEKYYP